MTKQQERVLKVLERIKEQVESDEFYAEMYSEELQMVLHNLLIEDAFGTEGQSYPCGDRRNGKWKMTRVEGIDEA